MFEDFYRGKRVLVTGHTGFKGSWLSLWLASLGAEVTGLSLGIPSNPSNFEVLGLRQRMRHLEGDVRNLDDVARAFDAARPQVVFHLAAQPIVRTAYEDPKATFDTNVGGTTNVLECLRRDRDVQSAVLITSDKCYRNKEWAWGYREIDELGGDDPYSASKAAAELVAHAYVKSFLKLSEGAPRVATVRAGNVIGGGDWAAARIVPDAMRAWAADEPLRIRHPNATRPWQHVLEPLSGYLLLGARLAASQDAHNEAFNFGPKESMSRTVADVVAGLSQHWSGARWEVEPVRESGKESTLLKLSWDKAATQLGWQPVLDFEETLRFTAQWYRAYYSRSSEMSAYTLRQIEAYVAAAAKQDLAWAAGGSP